MTRPMASSGLIIRRSNGPAFSCVARARRSIAPAMKSGSGPRQLQRVVRLRLEIARREASVFGNASEHARPDLVAIVEGEDEVWPAGLFQDAMGAGLTFDRPTDAEKR